MFEQYLAENESLMLDGGLATEIEAQGMSIDSALWSAELLKSNPGAIVDAHLAYLRAGAECIITASYQASRKSMKPFGIEGEDADELIVSSVALARQAVTDYLRENPSCTRRRLVAASVGPYGAALHDGSEYTGIYDTDEAGLIEFHRDRLQLLDNSGADVLACETIPSIAEARALALLLRDAKTPAWVSFSCCDSTRISDGIPIRDAAAIFATIPNVVAVGVNCTAPNHISSLIREITLAVPEKAIVVYPNSGETYRSRDNSWHGTVTPTDCAEAAATWQQDGATIIGGCCRMGPAHIGAMKKMLRT